MKEEKKEKVKIRITKKDGIGGQPSDTDAPAINEIAKKFGGKVTGGYKGGQKQSEIDGEIVLPENVEKIEIEKKK